LPLIVSSRWERLRAASSPALSSAARLCSIAARVVWPCSSSAARDDSTASAARLIAPSTAAVILAEDSSMLAAAAALPLSIRATWADMRWAAPPSTSSASRPRAASEASWASSALAWPWALRPASFIASATARACSSARGRSWRRTPMSTLAALAAASRAAAFWSRVDVSLAR
jgi:hypothetical protein